MQPRCHLFATLAVDATGERGLVGRAVDPDFLTNKFIVYHTVPAAVAHQLKRVQSHRH
jgi:hypothetical protein